MNISLHFKLATCLTAIATKTERVTTEKYVYPTWLWNVHMFLRERKWNKTSITKAMNFCRNQNLTIGLKSPKCRPSTFEKRPPSLSWTRWDMLTFPTFQCFIGQSTSKMTTIPIVMFGFGLQKEYTRRAGMARRYSRSSQQCQTRTTLTTWLIKVQEIRGGMLDQSWAPHHEVSVAYTCPSAPLRSPWPSATLWSTVARRQLIR